MAIRHLRDGEDFGPSHFSKDFGFSGSSQGPDVPDTHGPKSRPEPTEMGEGGGDYSHGGAAHGHSHPHGGHIRHEEPHASGGKICHYDHGGYSHHHGDGSVTHHHADGSPVHAAHGGAMGGAHLHPHGHAVTHTEPHPHIEGAFIAHHSHGGHTVHHKDGHVTHHHSGGAPATGMMGVEQMHDSSEYAHGGHHRMADGGSLEPGGAYNKGGRAGRRENPKGGDGREKALITKAVHQHENHEHGGEHTDLHLARGGMAGMRTRLPRDMRPAAARQHSPIETPPRDPKLTTTPRNQMSGGEMPYGVEPSAEPDMAGSEQGIPQMRRGGRAHHNRA